jgi:hypothetical protein
MAPMPSITMTRPITMKVYGRRSASLTIHMAARILSLAVRAREIVDRSVKFNP